MSDGRLGPTSPRIRADLYAPDGPTSARRPEFASQRAAIAAPTGFGAASKQRPPVIKKRKTAMPRFQLKRRVALLLLAGFGMVAGSGPLAASRPVPLPLRQNGGTWD